MSAEHEDVAHREIGRHFFIDYIANLWYNILQAGLFPNGKIEAQIKHKRKSLDEKMQGKHK